MNASDLCVVCKPGSQTDTTGGDLPGQNYLYVVDQGGKVYTRNLTEALITDRRGAVQCLANVLVYHTGYRIVSLAGAIVQDRAAAVEKATLPIAAGLTACLQGSKESDPEGAPGPMYLAVKAAINDLHGKPTDDRPWTPEEIRAREG